MHFPTILLIICVCRCYGEEEKLKNSSETTNITSLSTVPTTVQPKVSTSVQSIVSKTVQTTPATPIQCTCGIFLSGQFKKGSKEQPKGYPGILRESVGSFACTNFGNRMCTSKCLEAIVEHLHKSAILICGSIGRDVHRERAYLFMKNCKDEWINTNLSAGREYCCKDGKPIKCSLSS